MATDHIDTKMQQFAASLLNRDKIDEQMLIKAKTWYKNFTGDLTSRGMSSLSDKEILEIYCELTETTM